MRILIQSATNLNIGGFYRQGIPQAVSQAEWNRAQQQRELDANAKAVEILVRAQGLSESDAVGIAANELRRSQDAQARGAPLTPGHLPASAELADLLARFSAAATLPR